MRIQFKYLFSFFIILSFFGFGDNIITCPNIKNIKEPEWVAKINQNANFSKCYHYTQNSFISDINLNLHFWSNEFSLFYTRIVGVKILLQEKIYSTINIINQIFNKLTIPRRSIEYHSISCKKANLYRQDCLSCLIRHDEGNIMWNYLLRIKWINQQIKSLVISKGLNEY